MMATKRKRPHTRRGKKQKPRRAGRGSAALRVVDSERHRFLTAEKRTFGDGNERGADGKFLVGNRGGPGRPPGSSRTTALRETFASVFAAAGGEQMLLRVARKFPRDFLALMVRLEPRLLQADVDLDTGPSEPLVRVVMPWDGRCDPALLGDSLHHETEGEAVLRFCTEVEYEQARTMRMNGIDTVQRERWFAGLMRDVRAKLEQARAAPDETEADDRGPEQD